MENTNAASPVALHAYGTKKLTIIKYPPVMKVRRRAKSELKDLLHAQKNLRDAASSSHL